MSAHVSIHSAHKVRARASSTSGAPLILTVTSGDGVERHEVTLFTESQALSEALAAAINAVSLADLAAVTREELRAAP